ncbi:P-loop NTPase [Hydrogenibacillus sp. N12]|uniref:P-loop NTPase n=1 Tax=Hydrogenibacillus sp. N12 TaxID=2866627 RepID=UPI001C7D5047|nr:P-loop NTPase [Hydrogenibacillus sp. N12]QZA34017.1 Mrp/NBP35 family ATP-binding protein [Hydrogenibacillus sp. N12]
MFERRKVERALRAVIDPELGLDIVTLGMVRTIDVGRGGGRVEVALTTSTCPLTDRIQADVRRALEKALGEAAARVELRFTEMTAEEKKALADRLLMRHKLSNDARSRIYRHNPEVRILAVQSGKGGVGKSTLTVNLAIALARRGHRVGVLDADIYGHSIPRLVGLKGAVVVDVMTVPPVVHGVKWMSIGLFQEQNLPILWRGPMLTKTLRHLSDAVYWGPLDVLVLDLPPGTGDLALDVRELFPTRRYEVLVTTPEATAAHVAERAGAMNRSTLLGVIENMAYIVCRHCGARDRMFGEGGGRAVAEALGAPLLGEVPFVPGGGLILDDPHAGAALSAVVDRLLERIAALEASGAGAVEKRPLGPLVLARPN